LRGTREMRPLRAALVLREGFVALARLRGDFDLLREAGFLCPDGRLRAIAFELFRETDRVVLRAFVLPRPVFNPSPVRWLLCPGLGARGSYSEPRYPEIVAKASPDRPIFLGRRLKRDVSMRPHGAKQ